ncbi:MAG: ubiquinol-cytochrome c reductase iron-sulfur subunit, partial [Planctomycetota bacterium]
AKAAGGAPAGAAASPAVASAPAFTAPVAGPLAPKPTIKPPVPRVPTAPTAEVAKTGSDGLRRKFVFASVFGFIGICVLSTMRFFFPRVLFEPKTTFKTCTIPEIPIGVTTKFKEAHRIWLVRDTNSVYCILAICTHLGCTPNWLEGEQKFKCPCHGSGYDIEGVNFEGPAPRPMDRCHMELNADGVIVIDKARVYGPKDWHNPGVFLPA